jgi:hypothetical protein
MVQPLVSVPSSPQLSHSTAAEAAAGLSEDSAAAERCSGIEMEAAVASSCTSSLLLHTAGELRKKEPGSNISVMTYEASGELFLKRLCDPVSIRTKRFTYNTAVLRIRRDILVQTWIRGSVPLTNGYGSCYFRK